MDGLLAPSEFFQPWPQIQLMRPGAARLAMKLPIGFGNVVRIQNAVFFLQCVTFGEVIADKGRVDGTINDRVRDMNALRPKLPRHALRKGAQGKLCACKGRETRTTAPTCRCAGKDHCARSEE